jgi:hypothetical protein
VKAKADAIAEEQARLKEAQQVIHISEHDAVDALSMGLTRQLLLLKDASQDGMTTEQTIAKLLIVVRNQEKLMQSKLENRRELQSLRESMQRTKVEKLELPLTAKSQQSLLPHLADEKSAVLYAMDKGLIPSSKSPRTVNCPAGHALQFRENAKDFKFFRCHQGDCNFKASILTNTWFEESRLSVADNLKYMWAHRDKQHQINHELNLGSPETAVNHSMMLRELCYRETFS